MQKALTTLARLLAIPTMLALAFLFGFAGWLSYMDSHLLGGKANLNDMELRIREDEALLRQIAARELADEDVGDLLQELRDPPYLVSHDAHGNVYFITISRSIGSDAGFVLRKKDSPLPAARTIHIFDDWWGFSGR